MNFVLNDVLGKLARAPRDVPAIFPGPPVLGESAVVARQITDTSGGVVSGYVGFYPTDGDSYTDTWNTPLQLPDGWVYHYQIHRVHPGDHDLVKKTLKSIERTKLYSRFQGSENAALPFLVSSDWFAQYARYYDIVTDDEKKALYLPEEWKPHVTRDNIRHMWVEATVRVTDKWFPTAQPERTVVPIAFETDAALFLVTEEIRPQRAYGGNIDRFQGRVFNLRGCGDIQRCTSQVLETLSNELDIEFAKEPISAARVRKAFPPHLLRYERPMEPSIPLKGLSGPYYELSTYTITVWSGPAESFGGTPELYFTKPEYHRSPHDQIFLQLAQALQIAVGKQGEYVEPTPQQYSSYQKAVSNAIRNAVTRTTGRFGGRVQGDVGHITTVDKPR